jgi:hypothetical protein
VTIAVGNEAIASAEEFRDALEKQDLQAGIRLQVMRDGVRRFVFVQQR